MRLVLRVGTVVLVLAAAAARAAVAQQDMIPKELALALMPFGAVEGGEIIVGQLPPDLAAALTLPPGSRVLGSFMSTAFAQTVFTLPVRSDSALAVVRRSLLQHGWAPRSTMAPAMGGLQFGPPGGAYANMLCKAGEPAALTIAAQFYGPSTALVHLTRNMGSSACDEARVEARQTTVQQFPLATVPPLWSPGDLRTSSQRCRRPAVGMGDQSQTQQVLSELSAPEILAYYSRQLDSAGWKPALTDTDAVSRTWAKAIASRGTQEITLTIRRLPAPSGCYDVNLRATGLPR